jgi:CHAT domain-containing protein/predicted negative regulator of RcsB-dependent stress response
MLKRWLNYFRQLQRFCRKRGLKGIDRDLCKLIIEPSLVGAKGLSPLQYVVSWRKSCKVKLKTPLLYGLLFTFALSSTLFARSATATLSASVAQQGAPAPQTLVQQGKTLYEGGQFAEAASVLQQAADAFATQGKPLQQAMTLTNLSLAYQQLGQWEEADRAIATSLEILQNGNSDDYVKLRAAALDVQGQLYLAQGRSQSALESFSAAATLYDRIGDESEAVRSQINVAQAQQATGLYNRARDTLRAVRTDLQAQPDSRLKAIGLRSLGNVLRLVGNVDESQQVLEESLAVGEAIQSPQEISATLVGLGNTARAKGETEDALNYYQRAAETGPAVSANRIQAQLNQLSVLSNEPQRPVDPNLVREIQAQIAQLPPSRTAVDARINLARSLLKLDNSDYHSAIATLLSEAVQQAETLQDTRAQSYALGQLGALYEKSDEVEAARDVTEQALLIAQAINAPEIAYNWQWQLGRLLREQGETEGAIAAYSAAVDSLQSLRGDIVSINPDVQFSFRESVEPIYRQLVSLLLQGEGGEPTQKNLAKARETIESLQQAELINFFRDDCLTGKPIQIDEVDREAVVIYPIVLQDRLEVVLSLPDPDAPLRHYTTPLPQAEVEDVFARLRDAVDPFGAQNARGLGVVERECENRGIGIESRECENLLTQQEYLPLAQRAYEWLIRPAEPEIAESEVKTLVFVLDGPMLNVPMAVLHDGEQFLVEKYAIAYTPGLQLLDPKPLQRGELSALKAGLTEERQGFPALPFVAAELQEIRAEVPGELLLNGEFTSNAIEQEIDAVPFPVVHLATHGQFSSNEEDTFILTWDDRLRVNQLNELLRNKEVDETGAIELLVLSACQTATGDKRAALGLAGVAVRAGARSTLATLWLVDDKATADLMIRFYRELEDPNITKAEALRRAQITLLTTEIYQQPRFWAPYVLVGNWL